MAGSDSGETWVRAMYIISFSLVSLLVGVRIVSRTLLPKWRAKETVSDNETPSESLSSVS
jgi:hypothetical protein